MSNHKGGSWVTVPDVFHSSRIMYSQAARNYYVVLVELRDSPTKPGTHDTIRVRAADIRSLKDEILKHWKTATFSVTNENPTPSPVEDAKNAWEAERKAAKSAEDLDRANRRRIDEMTPQEREAIRTEVVLKWMAATPFIVENPNFFTWGDQHNWKQLLAYFDAMGWKLIDVEQVGRAFRYLWNAGCFQTKEVLQRSEDYLRPREFRADTLASNTVITPAQLKDAKRKLQCFSGRRITTEMALQRVSQAEWDAIVREMDSAKMRTTEDLKAEIVQGRRVRSRREIASDYKYV